MKASVTERDGKYYIIVYLPKDGDGKYKQKWVSGDWTSKRAAERDIPKILVEMGDDYVAPERMTLQQFFDRWIVQQKTAVRKSTWSTYALAVGHINERLGKTQLTKLKPINVQEYINYQAVNKTVATARYDLIVFKKAMTSAVRLQLIRTNPCADIEKPKVEKYQIQFYNSDQLMQLLTAAASSPIYVAVLLAATCGMRRGEIMALRFQDVDFTNGVISVRNTLYSGEIRPAKTDNSARSVAAPPEVMVVLSDIYSQLQELPEPLNAHVFNKGDGTHYNEDYLSHKFSKLCKLVKLPVIRFHDLRHSHASYLLNRGVSIKAISERLGHSSTSFTMDIYSHLTQQLQQQAAAVVSDLFKK